MTYMIIFPCLYIEKVRHVLDFWDFSTVKSLVKACKKKKSYPPRFTIEVSAKRAKMDTYLEVLFEGAVDELRTEVQLVCPEHCEFIVLHSGSTN